MDFSSQIFYPFMAGYLSLNECKKTVAQGWLSVTDYSRGSDCSHFLSNHLACCWCAQENMLAYVAEPLCTQLNLVSLQDMDKSFLNKNFMVLYNGFIHLHSVYCESLQQVLFLVSISSLSMVLSFRVSEQSPDELLFGELCGQGDNS